MATRRSSRLSAASNLVGKNETPSAPVAKVSPPKNSRKRKTATTTTDDEPTLPPPSTPKRKTARTTAPHPPSTPAGINEMAGASRPLETLHPPHAALDRLVDPFGTNAAVISPVTSRLFAAKATVDASPVKAFAGRLGEGTGLGPVGGRLTTGNILQRALDHLVKVEPKLKVVVEKHHCKVFSREGLAEVVDPFVNLTSGIIGQQVSGAAAKSIKARFVALFNATEPDVSLHVFPTPLAVSTTPLETLRTAGLSQRKAEYIQGLAEKFASGELTAEMLVEGAYEEVFEKLIAVRGLGKWSVEMFACFGLKRLDVFSTGDLGVQRGMASLAGRDISKLKAKGGGKWKYMSEKDMLEMAEKFAPYRSVFMWYMWRVEDVDTAVLE
ncbi:hypothetical protein V501_01742 [Pseudogymnoascus sp. VKM F-4519 (FW-2642)]|nr:hypothetical protein V501_01742 [Pseudogymnoascus sp. VKM F-4519 (FW-2642)]